MTSKATPTYSDLKTGVSVVAGFLVMSVVLVLLAGFLLGPHGDEDLRALVDAPDTTEFSEEESLDPDQSELAEEARPEPPTVEAEAPQPAPQPVDAIRDIPSFLTAVDADLYRRVFLLQKRGKVTEAKKLAKSVGDKLLMGHVQAQDLQRRSRPSIKELRQWLRRYADHPDYGRIKRLWQARKSRRSSRSRPPLIRRDSLIAAPQPSPPYASRKNLTRKQRNRVSRIKRTARIWLRRGQITRTERLLRRGYVVQLLDRYEMDEARGMIAAAWFYHGRDSKAYKLASKVIGRSGKSLPVTHWIAGLAAWRMGKTEQALAHFEALADMRDLSGWISAGAALWAARAHGKLGKKPREAYWLEQAAKHPYTLYGILALNQLGRDLPFEERHHPLTEAKLKLLASTKGGQRALALNEVGEMLLAEQELLSLKEWKRPSMREALRAIADRLQLPSIAIRLTRHEVANDDDGRSGEPLDPALYPIPPWKPAKKSGIDQALLFAIMRQESDFNAYAHSPVGALGLMQIMPATARMLNRGRRPFRGSRRLDKFDPETIVKFGLRYLTHLRRHKNVRNDLIRVIAGYNSGPGNIGYWARKRIKEDDDPLLFIEAIPNLETRLFVRRVLANLWIYRYRLNQRAPSLEAMAAGKFPRYRPIDGKSAYRRIQKATAEIPRNPDG